MQQERTTFSFFNNKRLILLMLLVFLGLGAIVYSFAIFSAASSLKKQVSGQLDSTLTDLMTQINLEYRINDMDIKNFASNNTLRIPLYFKLYQQIEFSVEDSLPEGVTGTIAILDPNGNVIYSKSPLFQVGKAAEIKIRNSQYTGYILRGDLYVYSCYPVFKNDRLVGAIISINNILNYGTLIQKKLKGTVPYNFELLGFVGENVRFIIDSKGVTSSIRHTKIKQPRVEYEKSIYISIGGDSFLSGKEQETKNLQGRISLSINKDEYASLKKQEVKGSLAISTGIILLFGIAFATVLFVIRSNMYRSIKNQLQISNLRMQKHEFLKHVNIINGLVNYNEIDTLRKYLHSVSENFVFFDEIEKVDNPAVSVLINQKESECKKHNITFLFKGNTELMNCGFNDYDICTMLGNLIDNAIEASLSYLGERMIGVELSCQAGIYLFKVSNRGSTIRGRNLKEIFGYGYTTKKDKKGHGMGLYLVKKLVRKYKGSMDVESLNGRTTFTIYLPERG